MRSRPSIQKHRYLFSPQFSGPKPWNFPAGSVQSRAAARAVVDAHKEQERKEVEAEFGEDSDKVLLVMEGLQSALARNYVFRLLRVARVRAKVYGLDFAFPTVDAIQRNLAQSGKSTKWPVPGNSG